MGVNLLIHRIQQRWWTTRDTITVSTTNGAIKGVIRNGVYEVSYYAFESIPYAKPPLGNLRFRAPQPPDPWTTILDCTNCKDKPLQRNLIIHMVEGSEDCLYLNVYVKKFGSAQLLPVIVFICGGAFQMGEPTRDVYAPDYFMKKDVIMVVISYRVGALGFLSLSDPELDVPGNAGLKDQLLALRWVKENIKRFNGDPNNITLAGESAGACSIHLLMLNDKAKGLFHKAILQSGTAINEWCIETSPHSAYRLARELGYKGDNNDKEVFRYITHVNPRSIPNAAELLLTQEERRKLKVFIFTPVVEPYITDDCIVPQHPIQMLNTAWGNEIPIMIGYNSFEGLFYYNNIKTHPFLLNELNDLTTLLPLAVRQSRSAAESKEMAAQLKKAYFANREPHFPETFFDFLDMLSYKFMLHDVHRTTLSRVSYASTASTYLYRFDFCSEFFNHFNKIACGRTVRGASHSDELSYLFYHFLSEKLAPNSNEYKTIERLIGIWTSFASTSNPNCAEIKPVEWEPLNCSSVTHKCLNINETVTLIDQPEAKKLQIWNSFYRENELF